MTTNLIQTFKSHSSKGSGRLGQVALQSNSKLLLTQDELSIIYVKPSLSLPTQPTTKPTTTLSRKRVCPMRSLIKMI